MHSSEFYKRLTLRFLFIFQTLLDALKSAIDNDEAPNYTMLVMMASLANVVPVGSKIFYGVILDSSR